MLPSAPSRLAVIVVLRLCCENVITIVMLTVVNVTASRRVVPDHSQSATQCWPTELKTANGQPLQFRYVHSAPGA